MVGYISLVNFTEPMVISRVPLPGSSYDLMTIARVGMLLVIYASVPTSVFQCKTSILSTFKKDTAEDGTETQPSPALSYGLSVGILYVTALIGYGISLTSVANFIAIFGGLICGSLLLFFPSKNLFLK